METSEWLVLGNYVLTVGVGIAVFAVKGKITRHNDEALLKLRSHYETELTKLKNEHTVAVTNLKNELDSQRESLLAEVTGAVQKELQSHASVLGDREDVAKRLREFAEACPNLIAELSAKLHQAASELDGAEHKQHAREAFVRGMAALGRFYEAWNPYRAFVPGALRKKLVEFGDQYKKTLNDLSTHMLPKPREEAFVANMAKLRALAIHVVNNELSTLVQPDV